MTLSFSPSGTGMSMRDNTFAALSLLIVVATKVWAVAVYGPLALGDNQGFVDAAEQMLVGTGWLHDAGLDDSVWPPTLWRPIGYSLVIATAKGLFAENWTFALSAFQAALSLVAGLMLLCLARIAGLSVILSAAVFVLYEWSVPLSTDPLIMEDSLTGSIGMIGFILVLSPVAAGSVPTPMRFLALGCALALCFTIRDVYHFVTPLLAIAVFILIQRSTNWRRGLVSAVALATPVFMLAGALQAWNAYRTGEAVITSAGQTGYLYGLLRAAQFDPSVIAGDDSTLQTVRSINKQYEYRDTRAINAVLFHEQGLDSIEQAEFFGRLYWQTLVTNPMPMIRAALQRARIVQQATLFAGPVTRYDDLVWWAGGATAEAFYGSGWRLEAQTFRETLNPAELTPRAAFHLGIRALTRLLGAVALVAFVVGVPWLWWRTRGRVDGPVAVAAIVWGVYGIWVALYVPVSFEVRYLAPVAGPAILAVGILASRAATAFRNRRGARITGTFH